MSQTIFVLEDDTDIAQACAASSGSRRICGAALSHSHQPDSRRRAPTARAVFAGHHGAGRRRPRCLPALRSHPGLSSIPIIFLTARAGENDRVLGLEMGADDYITKPFATRELVARVKAVLRRFERPTTPSVIRFEEVVIDANAMQLTVRGQLDHHHGHRVSAAGLPGAPSRPGFQPRPPARRRMGRCPLCDSPFGGCLCAANPRENRN